MQMYFGTRQTALHTNCYTWIPINGPRLQQSFTQRSLLSYLNVYIRPLCVWLSPAQDSFFPGPQTIPALLTGDVELKEGESTWLWELTVKKGVAVPATWSCGKWKEKGHLTGKIDTIFRAKQILFSSQKRTRHVHFWATMTNSQVMQSSSSHWLIRPVHYYMQSANTTHSHLHTSFKPYNTSYQRYI